MLLRSSRVEVVSERGGVRNSYSVYVVPTLFHFQTGIGAKGDDEGCVRDRRIVPYRTDTWSAEKSSWISLKIAENGRNTATLALKIDWGKYPAELRRQALQPFSLEGARAVRLQQHLPANAMRSQTDDMAKAT